ncbi:hypothetical protein GCK72_014954 [Caenorhabditis remanei]|uniref:F-box associated domain-containing protein n=1 Tax=Caenorhabditis remanei TaxID=31234 RepID=A0A6A5GV57_CAERE|nr:hypothetical protein GCK72_014954 [Caenorhabditis remanei]KAF1758496.1 hypothetical protein GCK72_014954 [Caenorhabditis remanei]
MIILTFLLLVSTTVIAAQNVIHIQYFRRPEEYGIFRFDLDNGSKSWESYIYMNRSANIREEDIYKLIKPFFEEEPSVRRYESSSITRHLGKQFEYVLKKYPVNEIIFMKPKFSSILASTSQLPRKIKWVIEHPSAFFLIPYGFTKGVGRDEYHIEIKGRASLDTDNLDYDALQNTQKLIIKNDSEMKNGWSGGKLLKIKSPQALIEGLNAVTTDEMKEFAKEWLAGERFIQKWDVELEDQKQNETLYFEKDGTTLEVSAKNDKFMMSTYKTPTEPAFQFTTL